MRGSDPEPLDDWIRDAMVCGIHTMQKSAVKLRYDISATRFASHGATARPSGRSIG
jgi:hypothetical protein